MNGIKQKIRAFRKDVALAWDKYLEAERKLLLKPNEMTLKDLHKASEKWANAVEKHLNYLQYLRKSKSAQQGLLYGVDGITK